MDRVLTKDVFAFKEPTFTTAEWPRTTEEAALCVARSPDGKKAAGGGPYFTVYFSACT